MEGKNLSRYDRYDDDPGHELPLEECRVAPVALRGSRLTEDSAGLPLGGPQPLLDVPDGTPSTLGA